LIPVGFGYGDGDEYFLQGWVWDNETRSRPVSLPSLGVVLYLMCRLAAVQVLPSGACKF